MSEWDWVRLKTYCGKCDKPHWYFFQGDEPLQTKTCVGCMGENERLRYLEERHAAQCQLCQTIFLIPNGSPAMRCGKCAAMARTCQQCGAAFDAEVYRKFCSEPCEAENRM